MLLPDQFSSARHLELNWDGRGILRLHLLAGQVAEPGAFMATVRKKLIVEQEFLEGSSLSKHAENLQQIYNEVAERFVAFRNLAGESNISGIRLSDLKGNLDEISSSACNLNAWCHWIEAKNGAESLGLSGLVYGLGNNCQRRREMCRFAAV